MTSRIAGLGAAPLGAEIPRGSARTYAYVQWTESALGQTVQGRSGAAFAGHVATSLTGPDGVTAISGTGIAAFLNSPAPIAGPGNWFRWLGGSAQFTPRVLLHIQQPAVAFRWHTGRYAWETVIHWPGAPAAGVDSGLVFATAINARLLPGSNQLDGIGLYNVGGVLKLVTRGNGAYEEVDLSAYTNALDSMNKIGLHLCQPTKATPARVIAMVNDVPAAVRFWTGAHALPMLGQFNPMLIHTAPLPSTFIQTQLAFYMGPDIDDL